MTASSPPDMALYWNEALAEDLLRFFAGRIKCQEAAADLTHETFLRFHQFIQSTPPNNARAWHSALPSIWRLITSGK